MKLIILSACLLGLSLSKSVQPLSNQNDGKSRPDEEYIYDGMVAQNTEEPEGTSGGKMMNFGPKARKNDEKR